MRMISFLFAVAITVLDPLAAGAQETVASAAADAAAAPPSAAASPAAAETSGVVAPRLFQDGTISSVFAEESADEEWARPAESRIAVEIERQKWPGLARAEVECRRSVCALLLVYTGDGSAEAEVKDRVRKALGFAGVRTAKTAVSGSIVSEVVFFR